MPSHNTFSIPPVRDLVVRMKKTIGGIWIDPYANTSRIADITNDLNDGYDTDYHMDAFDFLKTFEDQSVDGVLFDPPYSPRQVSEHYASFGRKCTYKDTSNNWWSRQKREIGRIVRTGGVAIVCGWNSGGIGIKYGFKMTEILLVPHGGNHNDTIVTVEIKKAVPLSLMRLLPKASAQAEMQG